MKIAVTIFVGLLVTAGALGGAGAALSQEQKPAARAFDYWQPDWMVRDLWGPGKIPKGMMVRLLRHTIYMQYGVPKEYAGAKSTIVPGAGKAIAAGAALYAKHCSSCHAGDGLGNGDAGKAVSPSPALLAYMIKRPISVDEYLLWAIADGGEQFDSKMPAFESELSRDEIWQIIAYMRAGFPGRGATAKQ